MGLQQRELDAEERLERPEIWREVELGLMLEGE